MDKFQSLIQIIDNLKEENEYLNYQETIALYKAIKNISVEKVFLEKIINIITYSKENSHKIKKLSSRESEIFKLIGCGFSSREISNLLSIQETTVSTHRKNIIKKLEISGVGQLQVISSKFVLNKL